MTARRAAACRCGGFTAVCEGQPERVAACHCLECQRRTGSVLSVQAWFPTDRVTVSGPCRAWTRVSASGRTITYRFCPTCGSNVLIGHAGLPTMTGVSVLGRIPAGAGGLTRAEFAAGVPEWLPYLSDGAPPG